VADDSHRLLIFGAGGSGREIAAWAPSASWDGKRFELLGLIDDALAGDAATPGARPPRINGSPVFTLAQAAERFPGVCVIAAVGDPALREQLVAAATAAGLRAAPPLVHPSVELAPGLVELGEGVVICPGSIVTVNVEIAAHVQVNVHSSVMHDARIGAYATLSPATRINGNVHVEARAFLGSGVITINGETGRPLVIGEGAIVGAGAVVTKNVAPGATVTGVPAREVWSRHDSGTGHA
jgi:sugar O-acyltransferase (sialic acid O-acetyltransferase NeuD family)